METAKYAAYGPCARSDLALVLRQTPECAGSTD